MLSHLAERFREVVNYEPVVVRKEIVPHLRDLPSWEIEVQAVDEGHVVTNTLHSIGQQQTVRQHSDVFAIRQSEPTPLVCSDPSSVRQDVACAVLNDALGPAAARSRGGGDLSGRSNRLR